VKSVAETRDFQRLKSPAGGDCGETFEQITEPQLLSYLKAGWSIVEKLSSGQVIVKRE